jgi:hypothetical protein
MNTTEEMDIEHVKTLLTQTCHSPSCNCLVKLQNYKQLIQGQWGTCWFVAVLNMILLSDKLGMVLKDYIKKSFPDTDITCWTPQQIKDHLEKEIAGQSCGYVDPNILQNVFSDGFNIVYDILKPKEIMTEFFSNHIDPNRFNPNWNAKSGGFPSHILVPYIIRLGFGCTNLKHLYLSFPKAYAYGIEPRNLKINRLCIDYLRACLLSRLDIKIFILTTDATSESMYRDIWEKKKTYLFLAKYLCYVDECNKQLVVYTLDCAALLSNNSNEKRGHAICAITCDSRGYLLNSYLPSPLDTSPIQNKTCSVYEYDWHHWSNKKEIFTLELNAENHTCSNGKILNLEDNTKELKDIFEVNREANIFTYSRDVGHSSFIYIKETLPIDLDKSVLNIHDLEKTDAHTYKAFETFLVPYIYLLKFKCRVNLRFEYIGQHLNPIKHTIHKHGIPLIKSNVIVHYYNIVYPIEHALYVLNTLMDVLPDEMTLVSKKEKLFLGVEYLRTKRVRVDSMVGGTTNLCDDKKLFQNLKTIVEQ